MLLQKTGLRNVNAVAHEGKVVLIATDDTGHLWYSVRQDGFEDSYLNADPALRTGWEAWSPLDLPNEDDDTSVTDYEAASLTREDTPGVYLLRSRYRSLDMGAAAPVQLVSGQGYLYVFRQAKTTGTLLCDRFVLDGGYNKLGRALEVRFKRSKQRLTPYKAPKASALTADSLDFRDTQGKPFYEPTIELCLVSGVTDGWFSVVRLATGEHEQYRWHIFAYNGATKKIDVVSLRASDEGLFELIDATVFDPAPSQDEPPVPRSIPGVIRRTLSVPAAVITGGPAATAYDLQQERLVNGVKQYVRSETRLMLAVPTDKGTATWSFGVAADGTLAEINPSIATKIMRSDERDLLLPLDTLDQIKPFGAAIPPASGAISGVRSDPDGDVIVTATNADKVSEGSSIEIRSTRAYNGLYTVSAIEGNTFTIGSQDVAADIGVWEKRETERQKLVFDGMISGYQRVEDGKLLVFADNHGLTVGDEVQVVGTVGHDGIYPVTPVDAERFVIQRRWAAGEAINVKVESRKRRGIILDGQDDFIDLPPDAFPTGGEITISVWARGGATLPKDATFLEALDDNNRRVAFISLPSRNGGVYFDAGNGAAGCDRAGKVAAAESDYKGGWVHWTFTKNAYTGQMKIYRQGIEWDAATGVTRMLGQAKRLRVGGLIVPLAKQPYEGTLADLAIYSRVLSDDEIKLSMFTQRSGQEQGLMGYWRLGAVIEGEVRTVTDISPAGRDGTVLGGASVGGVTLERKLGDDTTLAVKYTNAELVAVVQRGTYVEEIDFRVKASGAALGLAALNNADGTGKPVFRLSYWGKRSRSAEDVMPFPVQPQTEPFQSLGGGWFRARCRFTIPDGMAMIRSFELADVRGTWDEIDVHRQAIRLVSNTITESSCAEAPALSALADAGSALTTKLAQIAADEAQEAQLFADKIATEAKIALLADIEFLKAERDSLTRLVDGLNRDLTALDAKYQEELNNPLNYPGRLIVMGTGDQYLHAEQPTGKIVSYPVGHEFEFIRQGNFYWVKVRGTNSYVYPDSNRIMHGGNQQCWIMQPSGGGYLIRNPNDGRYIHREGGTTAIILYTVGHVWALQQTSNVSAIVDQAKSDRDAKQRERDAAKARLDTLNALLDPNAASRAVLEQTAKDLAAQLVTVQTRLATASTAYLDAVKSLQKGALTMPELAKDKRGLVTRGATLGFVRPTTRLSIRETCDGNVQLCYSDASQRIRTTCYDARTDAQNASYEQWLTDAGRACLSQVRTGSAATLPTVVVMEDSWSVEMWISTPMPAWEWAALAGAQDKKNAPLVVLNGAVLGTQCDGRFFSGGVRLDALPNGWHHVAAVKQGKGKDATVTYYVDGEKAGAPASLWFTSVLLDGINDAVDIQPASFPQTTEITITFWTRSAGAQPGVLFDAVDAQGRRVLRVSMPDAMGFIGFECGSDAAGTDVLEWRARAAEHQGAWTHWAFTKNTATGIMRAYRNGKLWARETGKTKALTVPTKVMAGKAASVDQLFYSGDLAQLCIYNKELSALEIQNGLGLKVSIEDTRLTGYWRFEGTGDKAKAKDWSKTAKDGTLLGLPVVNEVTPPAQIAVSTVGEVSHIDPPAPLPPLGRAAIQAIMFDTNDRRVDLPVSVIPTTNAITICFWTRGGSALPRNNSIIEAQNASNQRVIGIHMGWSDGNLYFDCGLDGTGTDRVQKTLTPAEMKGTWTHWAFTKNAVTGDMKVYQNGALWHAGTGLKRPIPAATRMMLGRTVTDSSQTYHGEVMELSIWDKALTIAEITAIKDRMLAGSEAGLMGYWAFTQTAVNDLSPAKRHGTYTSSYAMLVSPPVPQSAQLYFDGVDDHVALPEMNVDYSQGITVEAWVWFDKYNNYSRIVELAVGQAADNIVFCNNGTSSTLRLAVFRGASAMNLDASGALDTGKWNHFAFTIDATGAAKIYKNGALVASGALQLPANVSRKMNYVGRSNWASDGFFNGRIAEVRLWNKARSAAEILATMGNRLSGAESGMVGYWSFAQNNAPDASPAQRHGTYAGGPKIEPATVLQPAPAQTAAAFTPPPPVLPSLKLSELRIWAAALDRDEIDVNSKLLLSGNEPGLLNYLPMNEATGTDLIDLTGKGRKGVIGVATRWACAAPVGAIKGRCDGVVSAEYSAVTVDPTTRQKSAIMRSFVGWATDNGVVVLPDKRIEELELVWVGNTQFAPTLLGYIEGAPPIPSENLTESLSYNGATSVELVTSQDVEYRWNRAEDIGAGLSLDAFIGYDDTLMGGIGAMSKTAEVRSGLRGNLSLKNTWQAESAITARTSNRMTDRLELRGTPEVEPKFPHIGKRFVPKNVGYALVISGTADLFVSRLAGSRKVVGYQIVPIEGVPPDVNTITFLLNPAYVMAGSLDGLTGTSPTSDRFHKHVPAMRAQYGALYPASYMRIKEAYELKQRIENDDKQREAFFEQFNTTDLFGASMESQIDGAKPQGEVTAPGAGTATASTESQQSQQEEQGDAAKKRQEEINKRVGDPSKNAHAQASFKAWQKKMERLTVLAGKRNIVNTYVWDADGGLRTETQSFASTAEHTIGGSFSVEGGVGYEGAFGFSGAKAELTAMVNGSLTQTLTKSQSTTTGIELNVDLSGVESIGITNHNDVPILPGEKVDRYRFMTFYLEGSTQNFHDFWSYVVDPEWLRSNGEEARALRSAKGKANKAWRVLHRVTYVERPVLMGVGRDMRVEEVTIGDVVRSYLETISRVQASQQAQLDDIERDLAAVKDKLEGGG